MLCLGKVSRPAGKPSSSVLQDGTTGSYSCQLYRFVLFVVVLTYVLVYRDEIRS